MVAYRLKEADVTGQLDDLKKALASPTLTADDHRRFSQLLRSQRAAVQTWFAAAARAEQLRTAAPATRQRRPSRGDRQVHGIPRQQPGPQRSDPRRARRGARTAPGSPWSRWCGSSRPRAWSPWSSCCSGGGCSSASVSRPLSRLRLVLERQRDGDRNAQADPRTGAGRDPRAGLRLQRAHQGQPGAPGPAGAGAAGPAARHRRRARRAHGRRHRPGHGPRLRDARRGAECRPRAPLHP